MAFALYALVVGALLLAIRLLHLASQAAPPVLHFKDSVLTREVLRLCPLLTQVYLPPLLWGKSGHLQTFVYGKMGRINSPFPKGERCCVVMPDGATMTYDVFEAIRPHPCGGDYSLLVCPGIANHSESLYIQTFVHHAQTQGYRVSVLNHLGALKDVPLTSPRIFTYGGTEEYGCMVDEIQVKYPGTQCIAVGFSMGGNIVVKYLGESLENQAKVIAVVSCGQGYNAADAMPFLMGWEHMRRAYLWAMTQHMKGLLLRHFKLLLGADAQRECGVTFDVDRIQHATSLVEVDEYYTRRRLGFNTLLDYYHWASCSYVINRVQIPAFFLNSLDDPLVPEELLQTPKEFVCSRDNAILVTTHHGGHLGYFEGGIIIPDTITWLDKVVVQYAHAIIEVLASSKIPLKN